VADPSLLYSFFIFLAMMFFVCVGMVVGKRKPSGEDKDTERGVNLVVGTIFTLLGLLLAFTLSASAGRLDSRRTASIDEANAIGTAVLRLQLLPVDDRRSLQKLYVDYIDQRLQFNAALSKEHDGSGLDSKLEYLQNEIWKEATTVSTGQSQLLLIPAVNDSFDKAATRTMLAKNFTPPLLFWFLVALSLLCSVMAGEATAKLAKLYGWIYRIIFCLSITVSLYIVTALDNPRVGPIRIDYVDSMLRDTRDSIKIAP